MVDIFPHKDIKEKVFLVYGCNHTDYTGEVTTRSTHLTTIKLHFNSVISHPITRLIEEDSNNFYFITQFPRLEYIFIHIKYVSQSFIQEYKVQDFTIYDYLYMEIPKDMYVLPKAGCMSNE